jgi:hypothetical protein
LSFVHGEARCIYRRDSCIRLVFPVTNQATAKSPHVPEEIVWSCTRALIYGNMLYHFQRSLSYINESDNGQYYQHGMMYAKTIPNGDCFTERRTVLFDPGSKININTRCSAWDVPTLCRVLTHPLLTPMTMARKLPPSILRQSLYLRKLRQKFGKFSAGNQSVLYHGGKRFIRFQTFPP